uniref:swi5-dependent recombination DNA repair protein 1 homolog isoform X2 n=1 Tax=Jaculus jaculus TaxID=51337 RepID=UPI001E1B1386|nr:swi5-dependent recombination DNA repair protein 1 homolog isoform X2 [Jaculus jaculus]
MDPLFPWLGKCGPSPHCKPAKTQKFRPGPPPSPAAPIPVPCGASGPRGPSLPAAQAERRCRPTCRRSAALPAPR